MIRISSSAASSKLPPAVAASFSSLTGSEDASTEAEKLSTKQLPRHFEPPPLVSQSTILVIGFILFGLAFVWPPLILAVAFVASRFIPYCFRTTDEAAARRILFTEFQRNDPSVPIEFQQTPSDIVMEERYWVNSRGMCLCTATVSPSIPIQAVVCFCHGYCDQASFMKRIEHFRLVRKGIAMVYIEIEGHGRSDGTLGLIPDWDVMATDVADFFQHTQTIRFRGKPFFLMGESMGGAIAYTVYKQRPENFRGVVFQSPMCKISEDVLPPQFVMDVLKWLMKPERSWFQRLGHLPVAPAKDLSRLLGQNEESLAMLDSSPTYYDRNPRLLTAKALIDITAQISETLNDFDAPFLVQHGSADKITDPKLSQALYEEAKSKDKTMRIYEDMWHSLTHGESEENKEMVFNDVAAWVLARC